MENPREEKSDGLEIISIGVLYEGSSWDKKYWSSSRGKDRYPYPVGYQAVRIHSGVTYRMEIQEGPKGPLFVIASTDGESCSGQTTDIAWEHFQKKGGPRAKLGHGKRFSCKIDGTELFGFKNSLVQRLLRELVANVNGTAHQNSTSPNICNGDFDLEPENQVPESYAHPQSPDIIPCPVTHRRNRKRKIKHRTQTISSMDGEIIRNQDPAKDADVSSNCMGHWKHNGEIVLTSALDREKQAKKDSKALPVSVDGVTSIQQGHCPLFVKLDNRSLTPEIEGCNPFDAIKDNSGETLDLTESKKAKDLGISDSVKNNSFVDHLVDSAPDCHKESPSQVEPDLPASKRVISEEMTANLCSQKALGTQVSNASLERIDFDSEGQDLGNSMMKVLLPQALTLLKKVPSESKALVHISEVSFANNDPSLSLTGTKSQEKFGVIYPTEGISPGKIGVGTPPEGPFENKETKMHGLCRIVDFDIHGSEVVESVVPDSLEDEQFGNNVNNQRTLCSNLVEVGEINFQKKERNFDSLLGCADTHKESLNFKSRMSGNDKILYDTYTQCLKNNPEKDRVLTSDSLTSYSSSKKETLLEGRFMDACSVWNDVQLDAGVNSTGDMLKESLGIVNGPAQDVTVIPPNERSSSLTGFQMETISSSSKVAPFSSENGHSQRVVSSKFVTNVETKSKEFCETEVVQYHRRRHHSKGSKVQNGRIHQNQPNYNTPDGRDYIDTYKLSAKQVTNLSSACSGSAVNDSHEEAEATRIGNASSLTQCPDPPMVLYVGLLSESIICRNAKEDCVPEACPASTSFLASEVVQVGSSCDILSREESFRKEDEVDEQHEGLKNDDLGCKGTSANSTSSQAAIVDATKEKFVSSFGDPFTSEAEKHQSNAATELHGQPDLINCIYTSSLCQEREINLSHLNRHDAKEILADLDIHPLVKPVSSSGQECSNLLSYSKVRQESLLMDQMLPYIEFEKERESGVELVGCYMHPAPVLSMLLTSQGDEARIAVICGLLEERVRTIFMYNIPIKMQRGGCPSFVGYTMMVPLMQDTYKIELGTSSLQFTPDWQCLVLHSSIKAPSCRKGSIDCLCSFCTSDSFGENALKVVHVKLGYVSLVAKLTTVESVHCVLVCEPNHIVAVEESGRLHVWVMCTNWSSWSEEFVLPNFDRSFHHILELKSIPKSPFLIIGHNGAGDFTLWDLSKRTILSRFSAPGKSVCQVLPIGVFSWDEKGHVPTGPDVADCVKGIMASTKVWFSKSSEQLLSNWKDLAVWLLVSADCGSEVQDNNQGTGINRSPEGYWRLALLVKNTAIFGHTLDSRVTAIDVSVGHAIIGTCNGHVYMWEMSTGRKSFDLHYFQGKRVSCIASDSQSGMVAVASEDCKLLIFTTRRDGAVEQNG